MNLKRARPFKHERDGRLLPAAGRHLDARHGIRRMRSQQRLRCALRQRVDLELAVFIASGEEVCSKGVLVASSHGNFCAGYRVSCRVHHLSRNGHGLFKPDGHGVQLAAFQRQVLLPRRVPGRLNAPFSLLNARST